MKYGSKMKYCSLVVFLLLTSSQGHQLQSAGIFDRMESKMHEKERAEAAQEIVH